MSDKKALDKKRPYGTVSGPGTTHRYEQDGRKFDGMGNELSHHVEPAPLSGLPLSVPEIKNALDNAGVKYNSRNNSRVSLLKLLESHAEGH